MQRCLNLSLTFLVILIAISQLTIGKARSAPSIGSLDTNNQETGDGAGCFFYKNENNLETLVFVERDGYGWMRVNDTLQKLKPSKAFVMFPSEKGDTLNRIYTSGQSQVELNMKVISGCEKSEDNCAVVYDGTLILHFKGRATVINGKGSCAC